MNLRIGIVLISFVLTLSLLFGVWAVAQYTSDQQLEKELLALPGLTEVEIKTAKDSLHLMLGLHPEAEVQKIVEAAQELLRQRKGDKSLHIAVRDNPTERMLQLWNVHRFQIEEILAHHRYGAFPDVAAQMSKQLPGSEISIGINEQYLFLHWQTDNGQLIRILPRVQGEEG